MKTAYQVLLGAGSIAALLIVSYFMVDWFWDMALRVGCPR